MGQKVHPVGFRLNERKNWQFQYKTTDLNYSNYLHESFSIEMLCQNFFKKANISPVIIKRYNDHIKIKILLYTGILNNPLNGEISKLKREFPEIQNDQLLWKLWIINKTKKLEKLLIKTTKLPIVLEIKGTNFLYDHPQLVANFVGGLIKNRANWNQINRQIRVSLINPKTLFLNNSLNVSKFHKIKGLQIVCSGRLNGVEMAQCAKEQYGCLSLTKIHSKILSSNTTVHTLYGSCGIKVTITYF
nr:ribosomal protein S3 [Microheliella maris]